MSTSASDESPIPIRLYADYVPWPLWGPYGPIREDELPLSVTLRDRIRGWFNAYDRPRDDWPMWVGPEGASSDEEDAAWEDEARAIGAEIQAELGPGYLVSVEM